MAALRALAYLVGKQLCILLHGSVGELPPDQPLHVEDGVGGVGRSLVLRRITHYLLAIRGPRNI